MKIRCVIVDDEPLALDVLEAYIDKIEDLELLARVDNAIEAFNLLNRENYRERIHEAIYASIIH